VSDVGGALLGATGTLLRRTLPGREPVPRRDRSATEAPPRRRAAPSTQPLRIISLAFPILIAFLVVSVLVQYRTAQDRNYSIRIVQARDNVAAAQAQSNKDAARQLLSEADSLISEALLVKPNDREALVLQAQVHQLLDQVSLVVRLPSLTELVTLPDNSVPSRVIVHGIDVNVLDPAMQRIYKFLLNDSHSAILPPENEGVLMRKGDQRGSIVVSDLIDIVWMEAGGERKGSNLLALESGGTILEYDPSKGIAALTVADSQNWQSPKVIGSYGGNLYVLDTQRSQILRYKPQANAYTRPPENYIDASNPTDLAGAVDMAIDGYIYVLFADGKLIKFDGGKLAPFPQSDLDVPLRSPRAIFTSIAAKSVYVADTGNQRVVEFSKEGEMLRQFRPADQQKEAFADLRGLFVDEAEKKLYVTSGRKLYLVSLPEPPQPTPIPPPTPTSPP
jgi:hypothetical protein